MSTKDTLRDGGGQRLERLSVAQAARALGLTESGVRKRVARGTLPHERDENGTVWVFVDPLQTVSGTPLDNQADEVRDTILDTLRDQVATLKDQVRYLQAEGERKDAIIMTMAQRIPELEAAKDSSSEPPESPVVSSGEMDKGTSSSEQQEPSQRRSWWRQFFGLE
jgi:hypothetical protein